MSKPLPLADVRIISVEQYGAGPWGTLQLADLGAEVIKIEDPSTGGDVARYVTPYAEGEDSLFFETFNRGKISVDLDLRNPAGREVFEDLVRHADVVFSNLRGDVPAKIGITYDDLKHINPKIVCCSLTGFGMTGPRAAEPSYDYILQAMTGWMQFTGDPGSPPTRSGPSVVDYGTGFVAALCVMAGVHAAKRDGVGMDCDVSLFDTAVSLLAYLGTWNLNTGYQPRKMHHSAHPTIVPFQAFEASDGWFILGCAKEKFYRRVLDVVGRPELAEREGFDSFAARDTSRDVVLAELEPLFRDQPVSHWLEKLREAQVPCGPVQTVDEAFADEQTVARGMVLEYEHHRFGDIRVPGTPVRVGPDKREPGPAPQRGQHRSEVLSQMLGYDAERVDALARAGAFGAPQQPPTGA